MLERGKLRAFGSHDKLISQGVDFEKIIPKGPRVAEKKEGKKPDAKKGGAGAGAAPAAPKGLRRGQSVNWLLPT